MVELVLAVIHKNKTNDMQKFVSDKKRLFAVTFVSLSQSRYLVAW